MPTPAFRAGPCPTSSTGRRSRSTRSSPPSALATGAESLPRRERVIGWLLLAAALVLGVPACAFLSQDRMLFLPHLAARPGMRPPRPVEEVEFATPEGPRLRGWFARARGGGGPAPLIVYYGGNAEDVTGQAFEPWPSDWALALINYRGYGGSEGRPSEQALCADAEVVLDALARRPDVDAARIVLVGRSLGTGVATLRGCPASGARRRPHLAIRQHGCRGPAPLPVSAGELAPTAPVRLDRARARDQGAITGDRGRARRDHPLRHLAPSLRGVGRAEALGGDPGGQSQRPEAAAIGLGADPGVPRRRAQPTSWKARRRAATA